MTTKDALSAMDVNRLIQYLCTEAKIEEDDLNNLKKQRIDGTALLEIIEEDMKDDLVQLIPTMGPRVKVTKIIKQYAQSRAQKPLSVPLSQPWVSAEGCSWASGGPEAYSWAMAGPDYGQAAELARNKQLMAAKNKKRKLDGSRKHDDLDDSELRCKSAIFPLVDPTHKMYRYYTAVNEASYRLATEDASLISNKQELMERARKMVHDSGFTYKKKKSRSAILTGEQRPVYETTQVRENRFVCLSEDLNELETRIDLLEKERAKLMMDGNYGQAVLISDDIREENNKKRKITDELRVLQQKEEDLQRRKIRRLTGKPANCKYPAAANNLAQSFNSILYEEGKEIIENSLQQIPPQQMSTEMEKYVYGHEQAKFNPGHNTG